MGDYNMPPNPKHSAIVERLRQRIELCRRHHAVCQVRYEQNQPQRIEQERRNKLALHQKYLDTRSKKTPKAKQQHHEGSRAPKNCDSEQTQGPNSTSEHRNLTLIALQGSIKRKLEGNASPVSNDRPNGISDGAFQMDIKRIRVDEGSLTIGQSGHQLSNGQGQTLQGSVTMGPGTPGKDGSLIGATQANGGDASSGFSLPLNKEMKQEPVESVSCSEHLNNQISNNNMLFESKDDLGMQLLDPDLQDLFDELTNMSGVPPLSDIDLDNMLNPSIRNEESFNIDIGQQNQNSTPKPHSQLDNPTVKTEYSPGFTQASVGSPQMRPPSTGPPYSMANTAMSVPSPISSAAQSQNQPQQSLPSAPNRGLSNWHDLSHAQQLKKIADNRQQHALLQHQQQNQAASWPPAPQSGPSSGSFGQEKIPSPSLHQQPFSSPNSLLTGVSTNSSQAKSMNNCLYKTPTATQTGHMDMIMHQQQQQTHSISRSLMNTSSASPDQLSYSNTKPLSHFDPEPGQIPSILGTQAKPSVLHYTQQQQPSAPVQQQPAPPSGHLQSQAVQRAQIPIAMQQKMLLQKMQQSQQPSALQYTLSQHRQDQNSVVGPSPGPGPSQNPNTCPNPNPGNSYINNTHQAVLKQQLMEKKQAIQRQMIEHQKLLFRQQILADTEKMNTQEQLNRHLTRPPPDYKEQRRNIVGIPQPSQYPGAAPAMGLAVSQALPNSAPNHRVIPPNSNLLQVNSPGNQGPRMPPISGTQSDRTIGMYGSVSASQQAVYTVSSSVNQLQHHTSQSPMGMTQNNVMIPRQPALGQGTTVSGFGTASVGSSAISQQQMRPVLNHISSSMSAQTQRLTNMMTNSSLAPQNWTPPGAQVTPKQAQMGPSVKFPNNPPFPNQSVQPNMSNQHFSQRGMAPPNQITPGVQIRPLAQMNQGMSGQTVVSLGGPTPRANQPRPQPQAMAVMSQSAASMAVISQSAASMAVISQAPSVQTLPTTNFSPTNQPTRSYQGTNHNSDLPFDFLNQQGDSALSGLSSDSDFLDSLIKSSNDDWMKDLNLDEILGQHS
ncbi:mastermind-like protein 2 isoform X1 [Hemitrygon akajei]|uniref:mastermind-like protein 2 isoform X1 n=2 Tax=Hemitrygon akajei TaxID=2704970 RepID=UPI003BF946B4